MIVDRGRPVARLEPVTPGPGDDDGRLERLEREGILRRAGAGLPKAIVAKQPPRPKGGASGVRALIDDRRNGR